MEFLGRIFARTKDRDKPTSLAARDAQSLAVTEWGITPSSSSTLSSSAIT
jgi:hypothetical protein